MKLRCYSTVTIRLIIATTAMLFAIMPHAQSNTTHSTRIIGGIESQKNDWPFMVAIVSRGGKAFDDQICGGTLIQSRYVLTASHCINDVPASKLDVIVGIHDLSNEANEGQRIAVTNIRTHEAFNVMSLNNDIALLELATDAIGITPVTLITPELMTQLQAGDLLTTMGWGDTDGNNQSSSFPVILNEVELPLVDNSQCQTTYLELTDNMLCAGGEGNKDSCQGDSGGPLIATLSNQNYQAGIVSFGDGCGLLGVPGVYTRLPEFTDWISTRIEGIIVPMKQDINYAGVAEAFKHTFSLENTGSINLQISSVNISTLENLTNTSILSDTCSSASITTNQSCQVVVSMTPQSTGATNLSLLLTTDHPTLSQITASSTATALPTASFDVNEITDNNTSLTWYNGGDQPWEVQTQQVSAGNTALAPGNINNAQKAIILAIVENLTALTFDYKVSTEEGFDLFQVFVDDMLVFSQSGLMRDFETHTLNFTEGKHRIAFVYDKDENISNGDDSVYIDNIRLTGSDTSNTGGGSIRFILLMILMNIIQLHYTRTYRS